MSQTLAGYVGLGCGSHLPLLCDPDIALSRAYGMTLLNHAMKSTEHFFKILISNFSENFEG